MRSAEIVAGEMSVGISEGSSTNTVRSRSPGACRAASRNPSSPRNFSTRVAESTSGRVPGTATGRTGSSGLAGVFQISRAPSDLPARSLENMLRSAMAARDMTIRARWDEEIAVRS